MQVSACQPLQFMRSIKSITVGLLCIILMLNASMTALAGTAIGSQTEFSKSSSKESKPSVLKRGIGTLLCVNGGFRWVDLRKQGLSKELEQSLSAAFKSAESQDIDIRVAEHVLSCALCLSSDDQDSIALNLGIVWFDLVTDVKAAVYQREPIFTLFNYLDRARAPPPITL